MTKYPDRIPPNARRIGVLAKEAKVAIGLGCSNYYELCFMAQLAEMAMGPFGTNEDSTPLDSTYHLNDRGTGITGYCSEEQHQVESSVVTWLGSNVGRAFIRDAFNKAGIDTGEI